MKSPKYKIFDSVWTIHQNRVQAFQILGIRYSETDGFRYDISGEGMSYYPFHEDVIFQTKEALINSL